MALRKARAAVGSAPEVEAAPEELLGPAIALAKGTARSPVLARVASRGARAIEERPVAGELLAAAGRPSGGLLTPDDLASPRPEVQKAMVLGRTRPRVLVTFPWANHDEHGPRPPAHDADGARVRAIHDGDRH